jgi:D-alanyl-D-alanine carboxypeptidase
MTKRAHEIGALNSHFANPHGLTAPDHYSTARDLTILFRYAMRNPTFREIVQTKMSSVSSSATVKKRTVARRISVKNHNRLLWNFEGAMGGKTGYTFAAQKCFVGAVQRNGVTVVIAILGSRDLWGDTRGLLEYGFDRLETVTAEAPAPQKVAAAALAEIRKELVSTRLVRSDESRTVLDGYVLQVGAFRERDRAESLLQHVMEKGFEGFIERSSLAQGDTAYRVRLGPYAALTDAQEAAEQVQHRAGYQALIVPVAAGSGPG